MSQIKVQCNECGTELALPESSAGKNGRCPKCQTVFAIPSNSTATPNPISTPAHAPATLGSPGSGSTGPAGGNPFASSNPYVAPASAPLQNTYIDQNPPSLAAVTIPLIIAGVIYILLGIGFMFVVFAIPSDDPVAVIAYIAILVGGTFSIALGVFTMFVAAKVKQRKKWAWITAIIFGAMFTPSAFFFLGIPILIGCLRSEVSEWINKK